MRQADNNRSRDAEAERNNVVSVIFRRRLEAI
jgi:hypothetical protein